MDVARSFLKQFRSSIELAFGVSRAHLRSNPRLAHRHHGIGKGDYVDAAFKQVIGHAPGPGRVAEHYRNDGVLARKNVEPKFGHAAAKEGGVAHKTLR